MDSNYKQIALLLILPLMFASVQSASYQRRQRQVRTCEPLQLGNNIIRFYCKSLDMRAKLYQMIEDHKAVLDPTEYNVEAENQNKITVIQMLRQFNFTCKQFTRAMAIKRQLQLSVFNNAYYYNTTNGTLVQVKGEEGIRNVTSILEYMEIITSTLQNIENILTNQQCIVFSSDQYTRLYWTLFDKNHKSVLKILHNVMKSWTNALHAHPFEWKRPFGGKSVPLAACGILD